MLFKNDLYDGTSRGVASPRRSPSASIMRANPSKRSLSTVLTRKSRANKYDKEKRRIDIENNQMARRIIEQPGNISLAKLERDF